MMIFLRCRRDLLRWLLFFSRQVIIKKRKHYSHKYLLNPRLTLYDRWCGCTRLPNLYGPVYSPYALSIVVRRPTKCCPPCNGAAEHPTPRPDGQSRQRNGEYPPIAARPPIQWRDRCTDHNWAANRRGHMYRSCQQNTPNTHFPDILHKESTYFTEFKSGPFF